MRKRLLHALVPLLLLMQKRELVWTAEGHCTACGSMSGDSRSGAVGGLPLLVAVLAGHFQSISSVVSPADKQLLRLASGHTF